MKSFLFLKPTHLRIRFVKGKDNIIITEKIGEFTDPARKETEKEIPLNQLSKFIEQISKDGYSECSEFNTERYAFKLNGLRVELNKIDLLGLIIEVEALTEDESQIPILEKKIKETMKQLQVEELDPNIYKKMVDGACAKSARKIEDCSFVI